MRKLLILALCVSSCADSSAIHPPPDDASGPGVLHGSCTVANELDVDLLEGYSGITGELVIDAPGLLAVEFNSLEWVGGDVRLMHDSFGAWNPDLTSVSFDSLTEIGGSLRIAKNEALKSASFPKLEDVGEDMGIGANDALTWLDMRSLKHVGYIMTIADHKKLAQCIADGLVAQVQAAGSLNGPLSLVETRNNNEACECSVEDGVIVAICE